ncbi:hypothetical protein AAE02nite_13540 [Adhaeribacter aerolatus]|uniref:DUF4890 domain-containing protein n=1 Tax=Adhaeribacter aerolatus TaxID=670289 RepID=A0A512AVI1_9BACT|nr:hypothetical protein [Adhaeribacter aerolatus]GEO03690.1 hypothetical protein AAE02nite_13540 [Adhaeribacter aerolatus]
MKKLILSTFFTLSVLAVSAQTEGSAGMAHHTGKPNKDYLSTVSTSDAIRQLSNQMQLNEGQYIRLRDLSRAKNEQVREINNMYANDAATRQQKLQAANQEFERQLAQTVSQEQFTAYLATQGRAPANTAGNNYQATGYGGQSLEGAAATGTSVNGGAVNPNEAGTTNNQGAINANTGSNKEKKAKHIKKENRRNKMKKDNHQ